MMSEQNLQFNINVIDQNDHYWVLDKPAGLAMHPGAGDEISLSEIWAGQNPLWVNQDWPDRQRAGIVHRLDKDTSGIVLLAKSPLALEQLQSLFAMRQVEKCYLALAVGKPISDNFTVEASVSRDSKDRRRQRSSELSLPWQEKSKEAKTDFVIKSHLRYQKAELSLLECHPQTGRMHQIRVHLKLKNLPIAGDQKYTNKQSRAINKSLGLKRQMLHASSISFLDPWTNKRVAYSCPLATDFSQLLKNLFESC